MISSSHGYFKIQINHSPTTIAADLHWSFVCISDIWQRVIIISVPKTSRLQLYYCSTILCLIISSCWGDIWYLVKTICRVIFCGILLCGLMFSQNGWDFSKRHQWCRIIYDHFTYECSDQFAFFTFIMFYFVSVILVKVIFVNPSI